MIDHKLVIREPKCRKSNKMRKKNLIFIRLLQRFRFRDKKILLHLRGILVDNKSLELFIV